MVKEDKVHTLPINPIKSILCLKIDKINSIVNVKKYPLIHAVFKNISIGKLCKCRFLQ